MSAKSLIAVISDIHANLEATLAVFRDIKSRGVDKIFFLGDLVGYGPDPAAVLKLVNQFHFSLLGNHDQAALDGHCPHFNKIAQQAIQWTREQIDPSCMGLSTRIAKPMEYANRLQWNRFLRSLKPSIRVNDTLFSHDTPAEPGSARYVLNMNDVRESFEKNPDIQTSFIGHSHVPMIWTEEGGTIPEPGERYPLEKRQIINVGAVGQPRDGDVRACYVLLDDCIRFIRVSYAVEKTQEKIHRAGLDPSLAVRLGKGK